jgi:hypothetical protein
LEPSVFVVNFYLLPFPNTWSQGSYQFSTHKS